MSEVTFTQMNIALRLMRKYGRRVVSFNPTGKSDELEMLYINGNAPDPSRKVYTLDDAGKLRSVGGDDHDTYAAAE